MFILRKHIIGIFTNEIINLTKGISNIDVSIRFKRESLP